MRILFVISVLLMLTSCSTEEESVKRDVFELYCDAENVVGNSLLAGEHKLGGGNLRTTKKHRSGNYSVYLDKNNPFGFSYTLENIKKGDVIELSVWKNVEAEAGVIVLSDKKEKNELYRSNHVMFKEEKGWGQINLLFVATKDYNSLICYALCPEEKGAYFDDFSVKVYTGNQPPESSENALEITIPDGAYDTLKAFRSTALLNGVIQSDQKKYIHASINTNGEEAPVELRLKGDWTDHLETNKWSFRIKTGGGYAYKGMRSFSIQNPATRSFMLEWFAHKLFEHEDVLTTRYLFVPVIINGEKKGVYALEEHFDKQLLESRKRREGPIVKFDESGIWQLHYVEKNEKIHYNIPALLSAQIIPFKKNRTYKSSVLNAQFEVAQSHMDRYRNHDPDGADYFDVESIAKFLALSEVVNGKHGLIWHNQRHYFNPVTQKLEPIAYDCFIDPDLLMEKVELIGLQRKLKDHFTLEEALLSDSRIESAYYSYLKSYADPAFLDKIFDELQGEIAAAESLLQHEYPNIKLEKEFFKNNCNQIREQLPEYEEFRKKMNEEAQGPKVFETLPDNVIFTGIALNANIEKIAPDGAVTVSLRNFHTSEIEVIGYSTKENKGVMIPINPIRFAGINAGLEMKKIQLPVKPRRIHYKAKNCGERIFKAKPGKWGVPQRTDVIQKMTNQILSESGVIEFDGDYTFSTDVYIEEGSKVIIRAGTSIDLKNNAAFVSKSPVFIEGKKDKKVEIGSSDGTANGFIVLSPEKSEMHYAVFNNMNTMQKYNWTLTGAVTFYGSEVTIDHCEFLNNTCEDGLNLIRCNFTMTHSKVDHTYSDGFDADFCTGTLSNSQFSNTGNDCIDFSGSRIKILGCTIKNAGDKGISGGEDSQLTVENCVINGAHIAVASKDKSLVEVNGISIEKSAYGFAAYRKKPEYGPARIIVTSVNKMKADHLELIEKGSELVYLEKSYKGTRQFDIDSMYMAYSK